MRQALRRQWILGGLAAILASTLTASLAQTHNLAEGRTAQDRRFITGGVGLEESEPMKAMANNFSLAVVLAATSGAYLADTHIAITDARGQRVLDLQLNAPYLLVQLDPGRYDIEANYKGMVQNRRINIDASSRQRVVFAYNVPVDNGAPERVTQTPAAPAAVQR